MRSSTDPLETVSVFYQAFAERDVARLHECLGDGFIGYVAQGMPCEVGGVHHSSAAMIGDVWARVFGEYDICPIPDRVMWTTTGDAVVHGCYRGTRRVDDADIVAEFVHLLRFDESGRVAELRQITDTAQWSRS